MAGELENALKNVAQQVVKYIEDIATMQVETRFVQIDAETTSASGSLFTTDSQPAALTTIKLDGDSTMIVPMRKGANGQLEIDTALLDFHQQNVAAATEYRARILNSLIGALQTRPR